jgi:hypothetical protein
MNTVKSGKVITQPEILKVVKAAGLPIAKPRAGTSGWNVWRGGTGGLGKFVRVTWYRPFIAGDTMRLQDESVEELRRILETAGYRLRNICGGFSIEYHVTPGTEE